jgi:hypothetical protein
MSSTKTKSSINSPSADRLFEKKRERRNPTCKTVSLPVGSGSRCASSHWQLAPAKREKAAADWRRAPPLRPLENRGGRKPFVSNPKVNVTELELPLPLWRRRPGKETIVGMDEVAIGGGRVATGSRDPAGTKLRNLARAGAREPPPHRLSLNHGFNGAMCQ